MSFVNPYAAQIMGKIVASNKVENTAVKTASAAQSVANDSTQALKWRLSRAIEANKQWDKAAKAADKTGGLISQLWNYGIDGVLQDSYPIIKIQTWDGIQKQEQIMGGTAYDRAFKYYATIASNKKLIDVLNNEISNGNKNVAKFVPFAIPTNQPAMNPSGNPNIDITGTINTNIPVYIPGKEAKPTDMVDPTTGVVVEEPTVWTFNRLAMGGVAIAAGLFIWQARK